MNKAATAGGGAELLRDGTAQHTLGPEDTPTAFRDISRVEHVRCRTIAALPMLHVDPEVTAFAARLVQSRLGVASLLDDAAGVIDKERQIVSGQRMAGDFVLNLLLHLNDDSGALWNALRDEASSTASELKKMQPVAQALQAKAASARDAQHALRAEEMSLRGVLAQRYGKDFPSVEHYLAERKYEVVAPHSPEEISASLIGHSIRGADWRFESPKEIVSLEIVNRIPGQQGRTEYEVRAHVKGIRTGAEHDFRLRVSYERILTRWKLTQVQIVR